MALRTVMTGRRAGSRATTAERASGKGGAQAVGQSASLRVNQAGRPTAAELERRKARVMDVATDLFVTRGYAGTSLVDIAKEAGVATRTLYQHFGDKERIFQEVIFARDTRTHRQPPKLSNDASLFENLMVVADFACDVALQPRSADLMRLMIAESKRFPELIKYVANATLRRFRDTITEAFKALEACGQLPASDHANSGELFIEFVLGNMPIMVYTNWDTEPRTRAALENRVALFIRGRFGDAVAVSANIPNGDAFALAGAPA